MDTLNARTQPYTAHFWSGVLGCILGIAGCAVLMGWALNVPALKSVLPGMATMKANTAAAFTIAGLTLWAARREHLSLSERRTVYIGAGFIILIGGITLIEYATGWQSGFDQLLFLDADASPLNNFPGRMSHATALSFIFLGLSLVFIATDHTRTHFSQVAALSVILIAMIALVGYLFDVEALYSFVAFSSMAVHTAILFMIGAVGVLLARPDTALMRIIIGPELGSRLARNLLPIVLLVPVCIGWLSWAGERAGLYNTEFGVAIFALANICAFGALIWWSAHLLNQTVAERQQAEDSLQRSETRLTGIVDAAMDAIITIDHSQHIIMFNRAAETMFRYASVEMIGQPIDRIIPVRFQDNHRALIQRFGETEVTNRRMGSLRNVRGIRADDEEFPLEASISQITTPNGKYFTVILRDITERKQAEDALHSLNAKLEQRVVERQQAEASLRRSEVRLMGIVDAAMDAIITIDSNQHIIMFNRAAEAMFQYASAEMIGQSINRILPARFRSNHHTLIQRFGETEVANRRMGSLRSVSGIRADGEEFPLEASISQFTTPSGKYFTVILRDITERKKAEDALRTLNTELEQRVAERTTHLAAINKELEAFSYSVSHDLRAPLRTLNGFSQALEEDYESQLDDVGKEYLNKIRSASHRMGQLIDDLLQLARLSRAELATIQLDLSRIVLELSRELTQNEPERQVEWSIQDSLIVHGDKQLLTIMFRNLLSNAWKFTNKNAQARITFGQMLYEGEIVYFVRDNGAGFNMAYVDKLFGAFQRLHANSEFEGTGIGLATVQRIVHRHGGSIWAEGVVNEGATFYFTLLNRIEGTTDYGDRNAYDNDIAD